MSEGEDGDGCSGRCKGKGVQIDVFDGDCPEPCDQSKLDEMEEEAKKLQEETPTDCAWIEVVPIASAPEDVTIQKASTVEPTPAVRRMDQNTASTMCKSAI